VPAAAFLLTIGAACYHFAATGSRGGGPATIDVQVLDVADHQRPVVNGVSPVGSVDVARVDPAGFSFAGWTDLAAGTSLVLVTSGPPAGGHIRLRSLSRQDVADALHAKAMLYSGFEFTGSVAGWGSPHCLFFVGDKGTRLAWSDASSVCDRPQPAAPSVGPST